MVCSILDKFLKAIQARVLFYRTYRNWVHLYVHCKVVIQMHMRK